MDKVRKRRSRKSMLAWLPALLLLAGSTIIASGMSIIPFAGATTESQEVHVTGTVLQTVEVSTGCGSADAANGATDFAALISNGSYVGTSSDCTINVVANDTGGVTLSVSDSRAGSNPAFCRGPAGLCGTDEDQLDNAAVGQALGDGKFGIALRSVSGATSSADYTTNNTAGDQTQDGAWYPVTHAGAPACSNSSTAQLTCNFRFGVDTKSPQAAGNYDAYVTFTSSYHNGNN